jgi:hypothetical protein
VLGLSAFARGEPCQGTCRGRPDPGNGIVLQCLDDAKSGAEVMTGDDCQHHLPDTPCLVAQRVPDGGALSLDAHARRQTPDRRQIRQESVLRPEPNR